MSNPTFEPGKYTRFKDRQGRVFIVVGQERDWDDKRQESRGWLTITLYNLAACKTESPMPYDRFVHYVAKGTLTRFSPMSYQPRKF